MIGSLSIFACFLHFNMLYWSGRDQHAEELRFSHACVLLLLIEYYNPVTVHRLLPVVLLLADIFPILQCILLASKYHTDGTSCRDII